MRLKSKLLLGIFLIAFLASGATGSYFYFHAKNALLDSIRQQLRATAKMAALLVDGDVLQNLTAKEHMATADYARIQKLMGVIAQSDEEYLYAYTMRLDRDVVRFIVDAPAADDDGDGRINEHEMPEPVGAVYADPPPELLQGFVHPSSDRHPYEDLWGVTMSGYAPVHNSQGQVVGLIGIDMSLKRIDEKLTAVRRSGFLSLALAASLALLMGLYFSRTIFSPLVLLQKAMHKVGQGDYSQHLEIRGRDEIASFYRSFNTMAAELREKNLIKSSLGKVVGKETLDKILASPLRLGGEIVTATIMVCDLRGFSLLSEKLPPKLLVGLINDYFTAMVEIVQRHGGIVDKFVGDMMLAVFGHPAPLKQDREAALAAAREMIDKCDELNSRLHLNADLRLENSVALHSGPVLAGNIGSPDRMEYTVMGHHVNVAVRLEKLTRELNVRLAASREFVEGLAADHALRPAGRRNLPGLRCAMEIFVAEDVQRGGREKDA